MYYADLSPYTYNTSDAPFPTFNVGWLDQHHPFPTGSLAEQVLDRLWIFCVESVYQTMGFHHCALCTGDAPDDAAFFGVTATRHMTHLDLGDAEIRVFGENVVFAAPTMIYHYIVDHHYLPPSVFLDALMTSPLPDDVSYRAIAERYHWD